MQLTSLAMIPLDDWQFWVVSALAAAAIYAVLQPLLKPFLTRRKGSQSAAPCPGCPNSSTKPEAARAKHVDLTIGGKRVRR